MRHISARSLAPSVQRFVDGLSMRLFPNDMNPVEHAAPVGDSFVAVRCGPASLTAFVTASGQLYMTGQNFYGQGGVGSVEENVLYTPQLVQVLSEATMRCPPLFSLPTSMPSLCRASRRESG